jgi:hypothetical protein
MLSTLSAASNPATARQLGRLCSCAGRVAGGDVDEKLALVFIAAGQRA